VRLKLDILELAVLAGFGLTAACLCLHRSQAGSRSHIGNTLYEKRQSVFTCLPQPLLRENLPEENGVLFLCLLNWRNESSTAAIKHGTFVFKQQNAADELHALLCLWKCKALT